MLRSVAYTVAPVAAIDPPGKHPKLDEQRHPPNPSAFRGGRSVALVDPPRAAAATALGGTRSLESILGEIDEAVSLLSLRSPG
jgi:hypothetical protein